MKILTYLDIILGFIKQDLDNKEHQKQIRQILENENSKFLYSKKFFTFIEEIVEPEDLDRYHNLLKRFNDYGHNIKSSSNPQNFDDEFLHIYSSVNDNVVVSISCNQPSQEIQTQIPNIAILHQQQKPNYHWLVVSLAVLHPFTLSVDEIDFMNDGQIDKFFNDLFSIPKKISSVTIFDDYFNVNSHKKYAKIAKPNSVFVYYCTKNDNNKNHEKYTTLKRIFLKLELQTKRYGSHTRRIIFEDFIINPDIDLDSLNKKDNKMWSVHIRFSKERANEIIEIRKKDYLKFEPSR